MARERPHLGHLSLVALVMGVGLLLRLLLVARLSPHIDEPASVLAAKMVAERGAPILPSGVLYLQGATLSYLLAPTVWLGVGNLENLATLRLVSALAGTAVIFLTYLISRQIMGSAGFSVLAAAFVALDPADLQWSAHVRPYALLQALSLAIVWIFLRALAEPNRRLLVTLVGLFWVTTFTHIGVTLLWPAMVLVALLMYGWSRATAQRNLAVALGLCLVGPAALVIINNAFGGTSQTAAGSTHGVAFVGNHLLSLSAWVYPSLSAWRSSFQGSVVADLMPIALAAASGLLLGGLIFAAPDVHGDDDRPRFQGAILTLYWVPVLLVAVLTIEQQPRYFVHIQPLGYLILVAAAQALVQASRGMVTRAALLPAAGVGVLVFSALSVAGGAYWRFSHLTVDPDPRPALAYVAAHQRPGEPILVSMPPVAYLFLGSRDDLQFLAGPEDGERSRRYVRYAADGRSIDYWVGADTIASTAALCNQLATHPESWLVVDRVRLRASWAYRGPMADVITGATDEMLAPPDGALVLRGKPPVKWAATAIRQCQAAGVTMEDR